MQKKWLYRLIMSYLPIMIAVVFCLILVFFLTLNETTKKQTVKANQVFAGQVLQIVDVTMQNIDTMASKNLLLNERLHQYFHTGEGLGTYDYYQVTNTLLDFMNPIPAIESIYLYRKSDGKVQTQSFTASLEEFGDRAFIEQVMQDNRPYMWSGLREMTFLSSGESRSVVSLVKRVPYYSGEQGLIVINIRAGSLTALVRDMQIEGGAKVCLADPFGNNLAGAGTVCGTDASKGDIRQVSPYTGFSLTLGLQKGNWISLVSGFNYVWFILGLMAVIGGIVAMTYISHRHYRPLEQLLERVQTFGQRRNSLLKRSAEEDDFAFIDHALESLIEQTNDYEKQQEEGLLYRRTLFFKELLDGTREMTSETLSRESEKLGLALSFEHAVAGIVEIDYYESFTATYSPRDQSLLKFTVRSAIQEIAEEAGEKLWTEWVAPNRLGLFYRSRKDGDSGRELAERAAAMADRARSWVEQYLTFTVTFGFGTAVGEARELPVSYAQAVSAADRKLSSGPNRVYGFAPQQDSEEEAIRMDALLLNLKEAAQLYRLGNPDWEVQFNRSFDAMARGAYGKDEIARIVQLFKAQVVREMNEAPAELQEAWRSDGLPQLQAVPEQFEWIEEARLALLEPLAEAGSRLQELRSSREQYSTAALVRQYILDHYTDPNLSLAQISEAFDVNMKTLSRIFKEEFGEKFVDYLTKLRIEHAKKLLETTSDSVQNIAEHVGYLYPMSFIRVFKKIVGMTPGDYRKEQESRRG